jgi:protocatechuate 3,4-dioxygenase beta subunit
MFSRRSFFTRILGSTIAILSLRIANPAKASNEPLCALTPEQEQGPFFVPGGKLRNDLIEDREGIALFLKIRLVEAKNCTALRGASVEIWSCDASGMYSGYDAMPFGGPPPTGAMPPPGHPAEEGRPLHGANAPPFAPNPTNDATFLRGLQVTDTDGEVEFATLYPGCYAGRTNHIHLRVRTPGRDNTSHVAHIGQIFFPEALSTEVLATDPYRSNQVTRTMFATDPVYRDQHGSECVARTSKVKKADLREGIRALVSFNIESSATPAPVGGLPPKM